MKFYITVPGQFLETLLNQGYIEVEATGRLEATIAALRPTVWTETEWEKFKKSVPNWQELWASWAKGYGVELP